MIYSNCWLTLISSTASWFSRPRDWKPLSSSFPMSTNSAKTGFRLRSATFSKSSMFLWVLSTKCVWDPPLSDNRWSVASWVMENYPTVPMTRIKFKTPKCPQTIMPSSSEDVIARFFWEESMGVTSGRVIQIHKKKLFFLTTVASEK